MKPLLLLLPLALLAAAPAPPVVRVTFSQVTPAAYAAARQQAPAPEALLTAATSGVRQEPGRLLVPTMGGERAFVDQTGPAEADSVSYLYLGYLPQARQHLGRRRFWQQEVPTQEVLAVCPDGRVLRFIGPPSYGPGQRYALVFQKENHYDAGKVNLVRVLALTAGQPVLRWAGTPDWEPVETFWTASNTAYIKQLRCRYGFPLYPLHYTYARLTVQ